MFLLVTFSEIQVACEEFQKSRLATTIRAYQSNPVVHIYSKVKILEQQLVLIIAELAFRNGHARGRQLFRVGEVERVGVFFMDHLFVIHPVQHLYSALHHACKDLVRSEFVDELFRFFPFFLHLHCFLVVVLGEFS